MILYVCFHCVCVRDQKAFIVQDNLKKNATVSVRLHVYACVFVKEFSITYRPSRLFSY